jgi:tight adherence protein B
VARVRTVVVALIGIAVVVFAVRSARRFAVVDRVPRRSDVKSRLPAPVAHRIAEALDQAAIDVPVEQACQVWGGVVAGSAIIAFALGGSWVAGCGGALGAAAAVPIAVLAARHRRARRITAAVPGTVERVASELRAGGTIPTAISAIGTSDAVLAGDFARVQTRLALGAPIAQALEAWVGERPADGVDVAAGALAMCASVGGRSADALDGLASSLRDRLAVAAEARALSAQARMSAVVVGGTPLLYLAWSAVADRRALHTLTATAPGRLCLAVGLALEVLGAWWMRRIIANGSVL